MSILNSILKTFVGDKAKQDLKKITPLVQQINSAQDKLKELSEKIDGHNAKTIDAKSEDEKILTKG